LAEEGEDPWAVRIRRKEKGGGRNE